MQNISYKIHLSLLLALATSSAQAGISLSCFRAQPTKPAEYVIKDGQAYGKIETNKIPAGWHIQNKSFLQKVRGNWASYAFAAVSVLPFVRDWKYEYTTKGGHQIQSNIPLVGARIWTTKNTACQWENKFDTLLALAGTSYGLYTLYKDITRTEQVVVPVVSVK